MLKSNENDEVVVNCSMKKKQNDNKLLDKQQNKIENESES